MKDKVLHHESESLDCAPVVVVGGRAIDGAICCGAAVPTHPGAGALTALAFVLIIGSSGTASAFQCGKRIASYLGMVPLEDSSGKRRRLGISPNKEFDPAVLAGGSSPGHDAQPAGMAQSVLSSGDAARTEDRQGAMARKLAVRLYWTMRKEWEQVRKFGSHAASPKIAMVCSRTSSN